MPLNRTNQRTFYKNLYRGTGSLITLTFRKRGDDQSQATYTDYVLYNCREKKLHRTGENILVDMTSDNRTVFQVPLKSLQDAGCTKIPTIGDGFLNNVDSTSEGYGQTWMIESPVMITQQLFGDVFNCEALRIDQNT